jgi:hypothetical protein
LLLVWFSDRVWLVLKQSSYLFFLSSWDHRCAPPCLACFWYRVLQNSTKLVLSHGFPVFTSVSGNTGKSHHVRPKKIVLSAYYVCIRPTRSDVVVSNKQSPSTHAACVLGCVCMRHETC